MTGPLRQIPGVAAITFVLVFPTSAQEFRQSDWPTLNMFGNPGLIDMPSARGLPDGEIAVAFSRFAGITRGQITAQVHPRISGSFRYVGIEDFNAVGFDTYYDRSFDLRFTLIQESRLGPALTVGMQDFVGTGIYGAEYLVLSKQLTDSLELTAGLGWGRLSGNRLSSGFGERPEESLANVADGGQANFDRLFRGDIGVFGGVQWRPREDLVLKFEYSGDNYEIEDKQLGIFEQATPFNFGVEYIPADGVQLGAYYMYGTEIGLQLSFSLNPNRPPLGPSLDAAPPPIVPRPPRDAAPAAYATSWNESIADRDMIRDRLAEAMQAEKLVLEALELTPTTATAYLRNRGFQAPAQAIGRTARLMARLLPSSVEQFTIIAVAAGMPLPAQSFRRSDLEELEVAPDGAEQILVRSRVTPNPPRPASEDYTDGVYPRGLWRLSPYVRTSLFDPDNPLRADFGVALSAGVEVAPGLVFGGTVRKSVIGNLDENSRESNSSLPRVRSDFGLYDKQGDPGMVNLTGAYYFRPGGDVYARLTTGYLETMYAGVSSEVLWAPYDSRFALGAELNYVRQRDFDGGFGLQDYDVVTGHASLYYKVTDDYFAQIDAGRYLAGDVGATLTVERVFANGWRVGAFATQTDVSAEEFGEGSFDKGISLTVPLGWFLGKSSQAITPLTIRPVQRDGGARLHVDGRLHDLVEDGRRYRMEEQWGRFWR